MEVEYVTEEDLHLLNHMEQQVAAKKRTLPASFHQQNLSANAPGPRPLPASFTAAERPLPPLTCPIPQRYCVTPDEVEYSVQQLLAQRHACVGFDIEWFVTYTAGQPPRPVALLQLCTPTLCLLLHVRHTGITPLLRHFLCSDVTLKAGVGAHGDALKIARDFGFTPAGIVDLSEFAFLRLAGAGSGQESNGELPRKWSLSALSERVLGRTIDKAPALRCSNWEALPLSGEQRAYAALDAWASLALYQALVKMPVTWQAPALPPPIPTPDTLSGDSIEQEDQYIPACTEPAPLQPAKLAVLHLHCTGHSVPQIAALRSIQAESVQSYLAEAILAGHGYRWSCALLSLSGEVIDRVAAAAAPLLHLEACNVRPAVAGTTPEGAVPDDLLGRLMAGGEGIRTVKETHFPGVSFGELRLVLAMLGRVNTLPPVVDSQLG